MKQAGTVVLVHGLWYRATALGLMSRRLRKQGFAPHSFSYKTRQHTLQQVATDLHDCIAGLGASPVHVVAHSLGGLVALAALNTYDDIPVGKLVLLGCPVHGSGLARWLTPLRAGRFLLGQSAAPLVQGQRSMPAGWQVATIAGNSPWGLGRLVNMFSEDKDGTVAVSETRVEEAVAQIVLAVTHSGMMFSPAVANQVAAFLRSGRFLT